MAKLKVCIEKMQLTSEGDYYELSSFLGLLDLAVGNEPLPSSERVSYYKTNHSHLCDYPVTP